MLPYDKLTILRNRYRTRELRRFRQLVESYFELVEFGQDDPAANWDAIRAARSEINQMLPRVIRLVHAAGLDDPNATDPGLRVADVHVLHNIFGARYADGTDQAVLDVLDMALGVYEANRFNAWARTINPFHYVVRLMGFVAALPRRGLKAVGLIPQRAPRIRPEDVARLNAVASRFAEADELIESRFADLRDRQARYLAENGSQLTELAERIDFLERVLAQQRALSPPASADDRDVATPA